MFKAVVGSAPIAKMSLKRIGGCDLSERVRVVHDRREEVDRVDDGEIRPQPEHSGIVGGFGADEHVRVFELREAVQNLLQVGWAELGRAAPGRDVLGESRQ